MDITDILVIHYVVIDEYFSEYKEESTEQRGVRDVSLFLSALNEPKQTFNGEELYPDILTKAAVYLRSFALNHAFFNGNKRTALMIMLLFLEENGYQLVANPEKLLKLARHVVINKPNIKNIREKYLKKYFKLVMRRKPHRHYLREYIEPITKWINQIAKRENK